MTTTELIELLKKHERGGATGRPREVMFEVDDRIIDTDGIEVIGTGDGLITELYLSLPDAKPHWIPCSERLPKVGEDVLFSVSGVYAAEGCLRADGNWAQFRWDGIQHKNMVDAWMPLPQPYQGERREEP